MSRRSRQGGYESTTPAADLPPPPPGPAPGTSQRTEDRIVDGLATEVVRLCRLVDDITAAVDDFGLFDDEKLATVRNLLARWKETG